MEMVNNRCVRKKYPVRRCLMVIINIQHCHFSILAQILGGNSSRIKITKTRRLPVVRHDAFRANQGIRQTMPVKNGFSSGQSAINRASGGIGIPVQRGKRINAIIPGSRTGRSFGNERHFRSERRKSTLIFLVRHWRKPL